MNNALKNPLLLLVASLIAIWLIFRVLGVFLKLGWLFVLVFVVIFIVNPQFRGRVQDFFNNLFNR